MIERPALPPVPRIGSLFSGVGGLCEFAVAPELGGRVVWHAENDAAGAAVLAARWPNTPNLGDVRPVDWTAVEPVDVLASGFPCQDLSAAGHGKGMTADSRSGLWFQNVKAIGVLRPRLVVIENVRGLTNAKAAGAVESCPLCLGDRPDRILRALGAVLGNLADLGYDAEWIGLPASDVGTAHRRFRLFIIAWPAADSESSRRQGPGPEPARRRPVRSDRVVADAQGLGEHGTDAGQPGRRWSGSSDHDPFVDGGSTTGNGGEPVDWGKYAAAIRRWEWVIRRRAPYPTEAGKRTDSVLSRSLVEWMMGFPIGHVTDLDLSRAAQLRLLGNGCVPVQARAALRVLLARVDGADGGRDAAMSVRITM